MSKLIRDSLVYSTSDDRTGESLKNKLVGAIETRVSMVNSKPNLVVIDEIDGASMSGTGDQNFIKMLMDKVQAGVATGYTDAKKSKKGKPKKGLLRPIICICNDP